MNITAISAPITILLIEDNPGDAFLIQEHIEDSTLNVISVQCVARIQEAKTRLKKNANFDVILLDLNLPDGHGMFTFEQIYSCSSHIPIIALTGLDDELIIGDIISKGAQDYLIKGAVHPENLARAIRYAIDRKKAEQRLRDSEARFRMLIEKNPYAILVVNEQGSVLFNNPAFEALFDRSQKDFKDLLFGIPLMSDHTSEINIIGKNAQQVIAEMRVVETFFKNQKAHILLFHDITNHYLLEKDLKETASQLQTTLEQLKKSQASLIESEKLKALGTMTAGVAHELNNPMTGIIQYVQYCLKYTEKSNKIYPVLKDIKNETKRCIEIVDNLLTFSRQGNKKQAPVKTNIHLVLDRVLKLLSYRVEKEKIQLIVDKAKKIPDIRIHVSSMQQVFMNLLNNAIDAVQDVLHKEIQIKTVYEDNQIRISFIDNGCGIREDIQNEIYDPFFTSKPVGKGTGLGLSISKSIIDNHFGQIAYEQVLQGGTMFTVVLPVDGCM